MSVAEMKNKISCEVENLNEPQLSFILNIIDEIKTRPAYIQTSIDSIFEEAVSKYGNTLNKLAQ